MTQEQVQALVNAQSTILEAIDQAYQKGAFSRVDSVHITIATDTLASHVSSIVEQFNQEAQSQSITQEDLQKALEESPDNPANHGKTK